MFAIATHQLRDSPITRVAEAADAEIASTPGAKELETAIEATVPSVDNSKSAPKVEISPEVQQETAAAEAEAAGAWNLVTA